MTSRIPTLGLPLLLVATACSATATTPPAPPPDTHSRSTRSPDALVQPTKIVVVVMENSAYNSIAGNSELSFIHGTIAPNSVALTQMHADSAPSLPNYVWMAAGQSCGASGSDSAWGRTCPSVFDQMDQRGIGWTVFAEGYPGGSGRCFTGVSSDPSFSDYARKHVPPLLFTSTSSGSACTDHVRNFPNDTPADGSAPVNNFAGVQLLALTFVIPNLCHDMHNAASACGAAGGGQLGGDRWLQLNWASLIKDTGPNGAVILTWDEGDAFDGHIATFVGGLNLATSGSDGRAFDHSSTLRAIEDAFGLPCLAGACKATPLPVLLHAP